jgi:tryptophan-rich sensory protein
MLTSFLLVGGLLVLSIFLTTYFTNFTTGWYKTLRQPSYQPPPITFSVVWTILYLMLWIVISFTYPRDPSILKFYIILLALFVLWAYVYFELQSLWGSSFVLLLSLLVSGILMKKIVRVSDNLIAPSAFFLLVAWLFFASILNINATILNY